MTPAQRIDEQIRSLMGQYADLTRGRVVAPPKASRIAERIGELKRQKEALTAEERHSLGMLLPKDARQRNEVYRHLLRLPLIADFLYAACVDLQGLLERHGMNELTLSDKVSQICGLSRELAFTLSEYKGTEHILSNDETLVSALFKKLDSYLDRRMDITD